MGDAGHGREKQHQGHTRPHKAMQGHIRSYKAITTIQYHIFCSFAQFLFDLEHFSLMFLRQEEEEEEQQQQQQSLF